MNRLFISYSEHDEDDAFELATWLDRQGWHGLQLSQASAWKEADTADSQEHLDQKARHCEAVILLITPDWCESEKCQSDYSYFRHLNKPAFGLVLRNTPAQLIPSELTEEWYLFDIQSLPNPFGDGADSPEVDTSSFLACKNFQNDFRQKLLSYALDADYLQWPPANDPDRIPFRGLNPYQKCDGGVFFGREQLVSEAMNHIRSLRRRGGFQSLFLTGETGVGKSSLMRAGLLSRLECEQEHFVVLPTLHPATGAIFGEQGILKNIGTALRGLNLRDHPQRISAAYEKELQLCEVRETKPNQNGLIALLNEIALTSSLINGDPGRTPTIVIPVDHFGDMMLTGDISQNLNFKKLLAHFAAQSHFSIILVTTSHENEMNGLQQEFGFLVNGAVEIPVPPLLSSAYVQILNRSVERYGAANEELNLDEEVVQALAEWEDDANLKAAQIAVVLETLLIERGGKSRISLEDLENIGGPEGVLQYRFNKINRCVKATSMDIPVQGGFEILLPRFISILPSSDMVFLPPVSWERLPGNSHQIVQQMVQDGLLQVTSFTASLNNGNTLFFEEAVRCPAALLMGRWSPLKELYDANNPLLKTIGTVLSGSARWATRGKKEIDLEFDIRALEAAEAATFSDRLAGYFDEAHLSFVQQSRQRATKASNDLVKRQRRITIGAQTAALTAALLMLFAIGYGYERQVFERAARDDMLVAQRQEASAKSALLGAERGRERAKDQMRTAQTLEQQSRKHLHQSRVNQVRSLLARVEGLSAKTQVQLKSNLLLEGANLLIGIEDADDLRAEVLGHLIQLQNEDRLLSVIEHDDEFETARFDPTGSKILTLSRDVSPQIWDAHTGERLYSLQGHEGPVNSATFSDDGRWIITGSVDATARLWDGSDGRELSVLSAHAISVNHVAFSSDSRMAITTSLDSSSTLWDVETGTMLFRLLGHAGIVNHAAFSPDGRQVITVSENARLWNTSNGSLIREFQGHSESINRVAFSRDGQSILTASDDRTVRLWDIASGATRRVFGPHADPVDKALFGVDGEFIFVKSSAAEAHIRPINGDDGISVLKHQRGELTTIDLNQTGKIGLTGSTDQTVRAWNLKNGRMLFELDDHDAPVIHAEFTQDGKRLLTVSDKVRVWNATSPTKGVDRKRDFASHNISDFNEFQVSKLSDGQRREYFIETNLLTEPKKAQNACDEFGIDPLDQNATGERVSLAELAPVAKDALAACQLDAALNPTSSHFPYQIGRVYLALNNPDQAKDYFSKAAKSGHGLAEFMIAKIMEDDGDIFSALEKFQDAHRSGFSYAAHRLGEIFWDGLGVPPDRSKAADYWQQGAARGDPFSARQIARLYATGPLIKDNPLDEPNLKKAQQFYRQAVENFHRQKRPREAGQAQARLGAVSRLLARQALEKNDISMIKK